MWYDFLGLQTFPQFVIGSDENGTGALAGPIVVTAVVYPFVWSGFEGLRDSKKYTRNKLALRAQHAEEVYNTCLCFSQVYIPIETIDSHGMYVSLLKAHELVLTNCAVAYPNSISIVDGEMKLSVPHVSIAHADGKIPAVAAASVLGKEERDWWMKHMSQQYPGYGFETNMGYGTEEHYVNIDNQGLSPIHRKSYKPIQKRINDGSK